jgi:hypothetical protein
MPETISSFLERVQEAATALNASETMDLIAAVKNQARTSQLRLLIVGSTGVGRFSVVNAILGQPEFLPTSPIPKAPISVTVSNGENISAEITGKNGVKSTISAEKLRPFLTNPDTDAGQYLNIAVKTNCAPLKTCEFRLESINAKKSPTEWKELLVGIDYGLLVLKATALLSERERQFIREILQPNLGLERVVILLNQMDLVPEDEHPSIVEMVRTFLGSFESQPLLLEFSAIQAIKALKSGNEPTEDYAALSNLVKIDLVEQNSLLKAIALRQAAEMCLNEVAAKATRQIALIETSEAELQRLLTQINSRQQWLESRIQRAQQKLDTFFNTLIKEEFFRAIEGFALALRQQLPSEIAPITDINTIKRHLSGYLEALWTEFFNVQQAEIRAKLISEMQRISTKVEEDLKELVGDKAIDIDTLLTGFDPSPANLRSFLVPRREKNQFGFAATGLELGGFFLLMANLPLGLATIGSGQVMRLLGRKMTENSDRETLLTSGIEAVQELEKRIKQQVNEQFAELTQQLKDAIADLYDQGISKIRQSLEEAIDTHQKLVTKKEKIGRLDLETIPELRQLFYQIFNPH